MSFNRLPYRDIGPVKGLPLSWRDEVTGTLPAAVMAYLDNRIDGKGLKNSELQTVREYMEHYINAPCWNHMNENQDLADELAALRRDVLIIETADHMGIWISRCLDVGIDPL